MRWLGIHTQTSTIQYLTVSSILYRVKINDLFNALV